jgi:hypothetical protein
MNRERAIVEDKYGLCVHCKRGDKVEIIREDKYTACVVCPNGKIEELFKTELHFINKNRKKK